MNDLNLEKRVRILGEAIREIDNSFSFTILEIGALPLDGVTESFHLLLDIFPGSRIIAFEVDKKICEALNRKAKSGLEYFPMALGRTEEKRTFYETNHSMCCSLYKPNEKLISMYNGMEVAMLKSVTSIDTYSLDYFIKENDIDSVDFIKIDIQGAELDVFQGGVNTLKEVVAIVSEVEFVPHYMDQPLFGDVCAFLAENGIMFHKLLSLSGRALKPVVMRNDINFATQHMWSDALFIKHIFNLPELSSRQLLKMGLLTFMYKSPDVTFHCFKMYDKKNGTNILKALSGLEN